MAVSHEQLYELLDWCMDFGKRMLEHSGEFYPFGAVIDADGNLGTRGGDDGNEYPNPLDIYQLLSDGFTRDVRAGHVLAIALAANVNIPSDYQPPSPDGLRVLLETEGYCRFIYVPYILVKRGFFTSAASRICFGLAPSFLEKRGFFKRTRIAKYDEPFAVEIQPQIFIKPSD